MEKFEDKNPLFQLLTRAVNEVVLCYNSMPNPYRIMFGKTICEEVGEVGTYLNEAKYQGSPSSALRKVEAADHHLQNVKFWINQAPNLSFLTKGGIVKYSISIERSVCCAKTLDELGRMIGGWISTLKGVKGMACNNESGLF